jgi:hypothetical protein
MNTDRLNYSIKTIQPISELNTNSKALTAKRKKTLELLERTRKCAIRY